MQHGAHEVVAGAHGLGVLVPVGVDPGGRQQPLVHEPELPQPVPTPVVGQERQQVVELGRERVAVVLRRAGARAACAGTRRGAPPPRPGTGRTGPRWPRSRSPRRGGPASSTESSHAAEWKDGPAKSSRPCDGGEGGPVQLAHRADDRRRRPRSRSVPSAAAHRQRPLARGVVEPGLGHLAAEADALAQPQLPAPSAAGRPAGRAAPRSATPSRWSGRRRSCRAGWARRRGSPGRRSRARCRPRRAFFSKTVTSTPAWRSRCAAARPEAPAPIDGAAERATHVVAGATRAAADRSLRGRAPRSGSGSHCSVAPAPDEKGEDAPPLVARSARGRAAPDASVRPPARPRPAAGPLPPARGRGRVPGRGAGPGRAPAPGAAGRGRPSGAPPRTGAGARPPRRRPPPAVPHHRPPRRITRPMR